MEALSGMPNKEQDYAQAQGISLAVASFSADFTWDLRNQQNLEITLTGNITMRAPINGKRGRYYTVTFIQDSTGGRTIAWKDGSATGSAGFRTGGLSPTTTASTSITCTFQAATDINLVLVGYYYNSRAA